MNTIKQLNVLGLTESLKPVLHVKNMEQNKLYPVINIKSIDTQFGKSVLVETDSNVIFLPKRIANALDEAKIEELKNMKLALIFRGLKDVGKPSPANLVEFLNI